MPKVSVIIPIYNVDNYIRQALESVVNQTLCDIEIICINDCTPDKSFEIVKEYASKDDRFVLLEQETNQGQGVARNWGIDVAKGEYIMFLDPDDWLELDACEVLYNSAVKNNANTVQSNYNIAYEKNGHIKKDCSDYERLAVQFKYEIKPNQFVEIRNIPNYFPQHYESAPWAKIFKTNFLKENNIKFAPYRRGEDQPFIFAVRLATPVYNLAQTTYNYNERGNSSRSTKWLYEEIALAMKEVAQKHIEDEKVLRMVQLYIKWRFIQKFKCYQPNQVFKFLKENKKYWTEAEYKVIKKDVLKRALSTFIFSMRNSDDKKYKKFILLGFQFGLKRKGL